MPDHVIGSTDNLQCTTKVVFTMMFGVLAWQTYLWTFAFLKNSLLPVRRELRPFLRTADFVHLQDCLLGRDGDWGNEQRLEVRTHIDHPW